MKRFLPYGLVLLGAMIIFSGLVYDILFAGIPYQDPTPEMIANYDFHATVASIIRRVGAGICFLGVIVIVIRGVLSFSHERNVHR